jgi:hypothetical protein
VSVEHVKPRWIERHKAERCQGYGQMYALMDPKALRWIHWWRKRSPRDWSNPLHRGPFFYFPRMGLCSVRVAVPRFHSTWFLFRKLFAFAKQQRASR